MAWISVHTGIDGPKLRDLRKKLKCSKFEATGILVYFWFWGLENAEKDGHILHADKEDIEECMSGSSVGCKIPSNLIVEALVETGWIDQTEAGFFIHDWEVWQEQWYNAKARRERDAQRKRDSRKNELIKKSGEESAGNKEENPADVPIYDFEEDLSPVDGTDSEAKKMKYSEAFEAFWDTYPRKIGKGEANKKYKARRNDGYSDEELLEAAKTYALQCKKLGTETQYIKHPRTFLSENLPFLDYLPKSESKDNDKIATAGANPYEQWKGG